MFLSSTTILSQQVDALRANYSGTMISLTDICMKPLGQDCATQSVLQVGFMLWSVMAIFTDAC